MNELKQIENYFTPRRVRCLNIFRLEQEAGLSTGTLQKFINRERLLSAEAIDRIVPVLVDFGYKPANLENNIL